MTDAVYRLTQQFAAMRQFSLPGEGISRLAFSDEDWKARKFIIDLMKKNGLRVRTDAFGNVYGRREGIHHDGPAVICGSHIDSVPHGGNFDGTAGVLAALEAVHMMNDGGYQNDYPLDIVLYMCEESSRFGVSTIGSKAMCGNINVENMKKIQDSEGNSLYEVLKSCGLHPEEVSQTVFPGQVRACFEMHIEQGRVLENLNQPIGIVTGIAAPTRLKATIRGRADHSGATPMGMRRDALCAAAEIILAIEKTAAEVGDPFVGTTGIVKAVPNVMNVIPGQVELGIDLRSTEDKSNVVSSLRERIQCIAEKRKVECHIEILSDETPVLLAPSVIRTAESVCRSCHIPYHVMTSGAGHDTMNLARMAPGGMIFIPCREGISHNPKEWADMEDIARGSLVIYKTLCRLCSDEWENS